MGTKQVTKQASNRGFTLVEALVVIVILGILSVAGMKVMFGNNASSDALSSTATLLHAALKEARNISAGQGRRPVTFCRRNLNSDGCELNNATQWSDGWAISWTQADGTPKFLVFESDFGKHATGTINKTGGNNTDVIFRRGEVSQGTTFVLCNTNGMGATAREVVVNLNGRVRTVAGSSPDAPVAVCDPNA